MADLKTELNNEIDEDSEPEIRVGWDNEVNGAPPPPCDTIGKRHKWRGGNVCIVCGVERKNVQPSGERRSTRKSAQGLPELLSLGWSFAGMAISARSERLVPVGNVMQAQSPIAGPHLNNLLKRTPIYKFLTSSTGGVTSDIFALAMPPVLVGLATRNERTAKAMRPMVIAFLLPMLVEAAQQQEKAGSMMEQVTQLTSEQLDRATRMVDELLGINHDSDS